MLKRKTASNRRGTAAVEAAFCISFVLIPVLVGVWEVGRLVEAQQVLENACREAGRVASTGTRNTAQVQQVVLDYLDRNMRRTTRGGVTYVPSANVVVTITNLTDSSRNDPTQANQMDRFEITVSIPTTNIYWVSLPWVNMPTALTTRSEWYSMKDIPLSVDTTLPAE
jgi:Flp pilus assembly protein TadG